MKAIKRLVCRVMLATAVVTVMSVAAYCQSMYDQQRQYREQMQAQQLQEQRQQTMQQQQMLWEMQRQSANQQQQMYWQQPCRPQLFNSFINGFNCGRRQ